MSSDPNDFAVLTPGHFIIGRPLQSLPEPDMTDKLDNRLSQWQKLTKFVQFIWLKWRLDYLNNLQARHKWQFEKENVIPNSMVILKDENLPPCKWTKGRTLEIVKGSDGKVRVVKVKTPQEVSLMDSPSAHRKCKVTDQKGTKDCHGWLGCSQSGRPIFDDFFQHLWPYIGNNTANVVFQMVKCLWLIRIDQ
ncbi:integrase catalytic domain-containing protein [Trichonephila clavipes]|nr:integrase catalytic domain-containing protein [Trichonephila clavipes]